MQAPYEPESTSLVSLCGRAYPPGCKLGRRPAVAQQTLPCRMMRTAHCLGPRSLVPRKLCALLGVAHMAPCGSRLWRRQQASSAAGAPSSAPALSSPRRLLRCFCGHCPKCMVTCLHACDSKSAAHSSLGPPSCPPIAPCEFRSSAALFDELRACSSARPVLKLLAAGECVCKSHDRVATRCLEQGAASAVSLD